MLNIAIIGTGALTIPRAPAITYPYSVPLINPGFETGAVSPWVSVSGGAPVIITTPTATGTYAASLPAAAQAWVGQTCDIPEELHADVDEGFLEAIVACKFAGFSGGGGNDAGGLAFNFLDGTGTRIGLSLATVENYNTEIYVDRSYVAMVPPGTRQITAGWWGYRTVSGNNCDVYTDDFQPLVLDKRDKTHETVFRNDAKSTTGWTTVTGTLIVNSGTLGLGGLCWNGATGESYLPAILPVERYAAIDSGTAELHLDIVWSSFSDADAGRSYVEFYDAGNTIIGTRGYQEPADVNWQQNGDPRRYTLTIPANARSIRFGIVGTRAEGTELSSYFMEGRATIES